MTKHKVHKVKVELADDGRGSGGPSADWDYLNTCDSSLVEPDRYYTYMTEEVTCPECLDVLEREAREELRRIAAGREAGEAGAGVKHMVELVTPRGDDGRHGPDFVYKCDPYGGTGYTFDIEKVTCPECLDILECEAGGKLQRVNAARERVRKIEIAADLAAATPRTLDEWLRAMLEMTRTWWADRRRSP